MSSHPDQAPCADVHDVRDIKDAGDEDTEDSGFTPLSAEQAQAWRARHPPLPVWPIIWGQAGAGAAAALLAWVFTGKSEVACSAGYGALAVVLPAALFARGMGRKRASAGAALAAVMGWELVKIALTIAMLAAAPQLVARLHWLALLVGMVVAMKTCWAALLVLSSVRKTV